MRRAHSAAPHPNHRRLSALRPSHLEWLYIGDYRRNLAAINLFRSAPWQFPPGHIGTSDFPVGTNIVFMDGNLPLAIVTKLLGPFLGPVAQTYGAWIYLCALLQLWAIYWALRQHAVSSVCAFLGTLLIGAPAHVLLPDWPTSTCCRIF
ncbi:hypothetical protein OKW44_004888 [Paraburkholderia sp. WSM4174]